MLSYYQYWVAEFVNGKPSGIYYPIETNTDEKGNFETYLVVSMGRNGILPGMHVVGQCWFQPDGVATVEYFG